MRAGKQPHQAHHALPSVDPAAHESVCPWPLSASTRPIGLACMLRGRSLRPQSCNSLEMIRVTACSLLRHHKDPTSVYKKFHCPCRGDAPRLPTNSLIDPHIPRKSFYCPLSLPDTMAPSTNKQWTVQGKDGFDSLKWDEKAPVPSIGDKEVLVKRMLLQTFTVV